MNLEKDPVAYVAMLQCLQQAEPIFYEQEHAIGIYHRESACAYFACEDVKDAKALVEAIPSTATILVAYDQLTKEALQQRYHTTCELTCFFVYYQHQNPPVANLRGGYEFQMLQEKHLSEVVDLYSLKEASSREYLLGRIQEGMVGVFCEQELCGFIGVHDDGSMGLLEVKKEHQRKGLATALLHKLIALQMEKGLFPYGEVVEGNHASIALQRAAGLSVSNKKSYWYFLD